jgi:hypothetical protein
MQLTFAQAYEILIGVMLAIICLLGLISYREEAAKCIRHFLTAIKNALS